MPKLNLLFPTALLLLLGGFLAPNDTELNKMSNAENNTIPFFIKTLVLIYWTKIMLINIKLQIYTTFLVIYLKILAFCDSEC
jgi:hypothetical protein